METLGHLRSTSQQYHASLLRDRDLDRKQRAGKSIQAVFQQMDNDPPWDCGSVLFLYFKGCNGAYPGTLAVPHGSDLNRSMPGLGP